MTSSLPNESENEVDGFSIEEDKVNLGVAVSPEKSVSNKDDKPMNKRMRQVPSNLLFVIWVRRLFNSIYFLGRFQMNHFPLVNPFLVYPLVKIIDYVVNPILFAPFASQNHLI